MSLSSKLKLYVWNTCPYCQKVEILAKEKKVPFERVMIDPHGTIPDYYKKLNPNETVPTLVVDNTKVILESNLIAQYIDTLAPPKSSFFRSHDHMQHQKIQLFMSQVGELVQASRTLLQDPLNAQKRKDLDTRAKYIDDLFASSQVGGPFFLGEEFSFGDLCILPFLHQQKASLSYYAGYDIFTHAPHLKMMYAAGMKRESVLTTVQPPLQTVAASSYLMPEGSPLHGANGRHVLFNSIYTPYGDRVRLAANLTGFPFHTVEINLQEIPEWFKYFNPRETVPALLTPCGEQVHESGNIVQYIDNYQRGKGSKHVLFPTDNADEQYKVHYFTTLVGYLADGFVQHIFMKSESGLDDVKWAAKAIEKRLQEKTGKNGPFLGGAEMNGGDVCILPVLVRLHACYPELLSFDFFSEFKLIKALYEAGVAAPEAKGIFLPEEQYLAVLKSIVNKSK